MNFLKSRIVEFFRRIINFYSQQKSNQFENEIIETCNNYEFNRTSEHTIRDIFNLVKKVLLKNR